MPLRQAIGRKPGPASARQGDAIPDPQEPSADRLASADPMPQSQSVPDLRAVRPRTAQKESSLPARRSAQELHPMAPSYAGASFCYARGPSRVIHSKSVSPAVGFNTQPATIALIGAECGGGHDVNTAKTQPPHCTAKPQAGNQPCCRRSMVQAGEARCPSRRFDKISALSCAAAATAVAWAKVIGAG